MRATNGAWLLGLCLAAPLLATAQEPAADSKAPAAQPGKPESTSADKPAAPGTPSDKAAAKKPAAGKSGPADASDEEEPPPKKAPKRFVPTDKGKADEDIPFPVDI